MSRAVKKWLEDPTIFLRRLGEGKAWEGVVAGRLAAAGFEIEVFDGGEYEGWKEAGKHANSVDILCNGHIIEVKSRNLIFSCANDFPYDTVMVDTKHGFEQKKDKPRMYICVSQKTGAMIGLDVQLTKELWTVRQVYDRVAKIPCVNYEAAKGLWGDVVEMIRSLGLCTQSQP